MLPAKVSQDVERHLLNTTVKLSDGTNGQVFSRSSTTNSSGIYSYNCHLCGVANLLGERCLQTHISGRKHQTRFAQPIIDADQFRTPLFKKAQIQMTIAPGEPVPPGFENEVKPIAKIQAQLDKIKDDAFVGLEYLMELTMGSGKEPAYHCILCDKRGDPRTIIVHLTSYNHRLKYLEKHFPTCVRELASFRFNRDAREVMPKVLQRICEAVEDAHGRLTPNVYENNNYNQKRMKYFHEAINDRHFDEKMGSTFVNVIDKKIIQDAIKSGDTSDIKTRKRESSPMNVPVPKRQRTRSERNSLDSVSSISSSSIDGKSPIRLEARVIGTIDLRSKSRSLSLSPIKSRSSKSPVFKRKRSRSPSKRSPPSSHRSRSKSRQVAPTPRELAIQSCEIAKEGYKWEKYRCMVEIAMVEMDKVLKEHEKSPENHPMYPEEWKKFWNKRYKELQAEKKDPAKHDFKPEWIQYWTRRLNEIHQVEIEKKKAEIRKKLNLPKDGKERTDELKQQYIMKVKSKERSKSKEASVTTHRRSHDLDKTKRERSRDRARERERERDRERSRERERVRERDRVRARSRRRSTSSEEELRHRSKNRRSKSPPARKPSYPREVENLPSYHSRETIPPPNEYYRYERYDEWGRPYYPPHVKVPPPYYYPPATAPAPKSPIYEEEDEGPLTVVSVLRLLTALEELLGSLGPKVNDLLAKALALEKLKANSADDILINEDNCVIFETIKEKLKGQLIAGVLEKNKIAAVKKAIKNVAAVIHEVTKKTKEKSKDEVSSAEAATVPDALRTTTVVAAPLSVPTALSTPTSVSSANQTATSTDSEKAEKLLIAQKIATALVMQGKTDVSDEQLQQLVNVYLEMQQKTKETKKAISTASYLEETNAKQMVPPAVPAPTVTVSNIQLEEKIVAPRKEPPKELETQIENDLPPDASSALESLTDSDLQTLLQNFKDLSTEEQQHLVAYLKKLEGSNPARVEKLRKFVSVDMMKGNVQNAEPEEDEPEEEEEDDEKPMDKIIIPTQCKEPKPLSSSNNNSAPDRFSDEENTSFHRKFVDSEDEDDDYTYDDVFRAASKNLKEKQLQEEMRRENEDDGSNASRVSADSTSTQNLNMSIADTQNLIANLMGSLQKNTQNQQNNNKTFINSFAPVDSERDKGSMQTNNFSQPPPIVPAKNQSYSMQPHSLTNLPGSSQSQSTSLPQLPQIQLQLPHQQTNLQQQQQQQQTQQVRYPSNVPFYQQPNAFYSDANAYANKQQNTYPYNGAAQNGSNYYQGYGQNYDATAGASYAQNATAAYGNAVATVAAVAAAAAAANVNMYGNMSYPQNNTAALQQNAYFAQQSSGQQGIAGQQIRGQQQQQQMQQQQQQQMQQQQQRQNNQQPRPLMQQSRNANLQQIRTQGSSGQPRPLIQQKQVRPNQQQQQSRYGGGNQYNYF